MSIVCIEVFDPEHWSTVDGLRPPASSFIAYLPAYLDAPVDVPGPARAPFLRVEPAPASAERARDLSASIVGAIVEQLRAHGPYAACSDPAGYERRRRAAAAWLASLPPLPGAPMLRWKGRDCVTPIIVGVLERLVGSFSLTPEHAAGLASQLAGAPAQDGLLAVAAQVARGGTWPTDLDGARLDAEAREVAEANRRSDEARARNAAEATKIVDVVVGEAGIEGWRCRVGVLPPFPHLLSGGGVAGPQARPPTVVQGSWQYWLRHTIPGEPLPTFTLGDGAGTVPSGTVLRMSRAQLAAVPGCWSDVFEVRSLREGHGAIDRRALAPEELLGAGDAQYEALAEHAGALIREHLQALFHPTMAPYKRLHVVSALVRGLLLRPDVAAELLWDQLGALAAPPPAHLPQPRPTTNNSWLPADDDLVNTWMPTESHTVEISGVRGGEGHRVPEEAPPAPVYPQNGFGQTEIEAACLAAAGGAAFWSWHSPGVLLEPLRPTLLQRLAGVVRQDPWEPLLRAALRDKADAKLRTDDVVQLLVDAGQDVAKERTADTSRLKKVLGKMGWTKREFEVEGERFRAYAREVRL